MICQLTRTKALSPLDVNPTVSGSQQPPDGAKRLFAGLDHGKNTDEPADNIEQSIQEEGAADAELGEQRRKAEADQQVEGPAKGAAQEFIYLPGLLG